MTASEAREALGRELTEAAVLRGLCELWQGLRVSPVYTGEGQPARWEMLRVHHKEALATATATGQVTAISLLVSMYLQSVYAATAEEVEIFLSPVTSRSRVREAVRGLAATRQIHTLSMDAQTYYFLENGLPEFADVPASVPAETPESVPAAPRRPMPAPRKMQATRPPLPEQPATAASEPIFKRPRPAVPPAVRPAAPAARPDVDRPAWKPAARSADKPYPRREGGQRPPFRSGGAPSPRPGRSNEGFARSSERTEGRTQDRAPGARPREGRPAFARPGTGRPAAARPGSARPPFARPGGPRPGTDRPESTRPPFARSGSGRPGSARPGSRPPFARPGGPRPGTDRPESTRPPFARSASGRPDSGRPASARPPAGGKPWRDAGTGARAGNRPRPFTGEAKRDAPKPWALPGRKTGGPPRPPRPGGRSDRPFESRAPRGDARGPAAGGERPSRGPGRPSSSRPPSNYRPNPRVPSGERGTTQEAGQAPGRSAYTKGPKGSQGRGFPPRTGRPYPPRSSGEATDRPAFRRSAPGERPRSASRPAQTDAAGKPRAAGRPPYKPRFDKPRSGPREGTGGDAGSRPSKAPGASRGPRPPFVPGGPPRKSGFTRSGPGAGRSAGPRSSERSRNVQ